MGRFLFLVVVVLGGALLLASAGKGSHVTPAAAAASPGAVTVPPTDVGNLLLIPTMRWHGAQYGYAEADLTFDNRSSISWKDAMILCMFYGASGTVISQRQVVVYQQFPPKKRVVARHINLGLINPQSKTARCDVLNASMQ